MNKGLFGLLVCCVLLWGCGDPGADLFRSQPASHAGAGGSAGDSGSGGESSGGGSEASSGGSDASSGSGGTGTGSSTSEASSGGSGTSSSGMGGSGTGSSSSSGVGGGCVPNGCPSPSYCGSWDDGCGNTTDCNPCSGSSSCGSDHQCHECVPTKTPEVVCQANNCGFYVDDCGIQQECVPTPNDGVQGCAGYMYCTAGDLPWVPYATPTPDWNHVGKCTGCQRAQNFDGLCGTSGDAYSCPVDFADNVQDETETDIDCGGFNPAKCDVGQACKQDSDCLEDRCIMGTCAHTSFSNPGCLNLKQIFSGHDIMCCQ